MRNNGYEIDIMWDVIGKKNLLVCSKVDTVTDSGASFGRFFALELPQELVDKFHALSKEEQKVGDV